MAPGTRHWKTFWRHNTSCPVALRLSFSHKMPGIMSNSWCCVLDVIPVRKRKANVYSIFFRYIFHIYIYLKILVKTKKWSPWKCSFNSNIDTFVFSYCSKSLLLCSWNYFLILFKKCLFLFWARFYILIKYVYLKYISFVDSNTYTPSTRNRRRETKLSSIKNCGIISSLYIIIYIFLGFNANKTTNLVCGLYVIPFMNHVVCIHVYTGEDDINKLPEDWENVQNE